MNNSEDLEKKWAAADAEFAAEAEKENKGWMNKEGDPDLSDVDIARKYAEQEAELRDFYATLASNPEAEIARIESGGTGKIEKAFASILRLKKLNREFVLSPEVLTRLTNAFKADKGRTFNDWSHSLCHLFEKYGYGKEMSGGGGSFLNTPDTISYGKELMEEAVRRVGVRKGIGADSGCLDRIIGPVIEYNLDHLPDDTNSPFALYPDAEDGIKQRAIDLLGGREAKYTGPKAAFLESSDPKMFIAYLLEHKSPLLATAGEKIIPYLRAIEGQLGAEAAAKLIPESLRTDNGIVSFDNLINNLEVASEQHDLAPESLYVDVDGTIIINEQLNKRVVDQIRESEIPVVIFSGGDPARQTERLRALGFPEKYLPVVSKSDFRGKMLQGQLIDDTPPEYQGFSAQNYKTESDY